MFKHLILVVSLLFVAACSENYVDRTDENQVSVAGVNEFNLASVNSIVMDAAPDDAFHFIRTESIGGLMLDMPPNQFTALLPCTVQKGEATLWAGIGEIIQAWDYAECGVKLQLSSPDKHSPQIISSIRVTAPSKLKTTRGISIGSDVSQVLEAYREFANEGDNQTGETFIAGSVYGGLFVQFENNQVSSLFLGSGAE